MSLFLIRYAEIGLKSDRVRRRFINRLKEDMENNLMENNVDHIVEEERGRVFVETSDPDATTAVLRTINGIHSFSLVEPCSSSWDGIMECLKKVGEENISENMTFGLKVKRVGKHPYSSQDIAINGGSAVLSHLPEGVNSVDLRDPDVWFEVEIRSKMAYIFTTRIRGKGGMPSSTQGRSILYLPGVGDMDEMERERINLRVRISRLLMERRGVKVIPCCWKGDLDLWIDLMADTHGERPFYIEGEDLESALMATLIKLDARAVIYPIPLDGISSYPLLHDKGESVAAFFPTAALDDNELETWSGFFG